MKHSAYVVLLVIVLFGSRLVFLAPFHFDDHLMLAMPSVADPDGWLRLFRIQETRPLTILSFWLNYRVAGASPVLWHLANVILHGINCVLLLRALRQLVPPPVALFAAAIFAIHPLQVEPVAYVFARSTLLATLFSLVTINLWLAGRHWLAVAAFALALLSKEECVAVPLFLLILDRRREGWPAIGAMLVTGLAAGLRAIYATAIIAGSGSGFGAGQTPWSYFSAQGLAITRYLRQLVVPYGFTVDPQLDVAPLTAVLAWVLIAGLIALAWRYKGRLGPGFWFLGGLLLLAPSSSVLPADDLAADRRMYLPLIAFSVVIALLVVRWKPWSYGLLAMFFLAALIQLQVWLSNSALWKQAVERSPDKVRPRIQLARAVKSPGEARGILEEAEKRFPDDAAISNEFGRVLLVEGKPAEALGKFGRALALAPSNALYLNNRGVALFSLGQKEAARADFDRALQIDPCLADAHANKSKTGAGSQLPSFCF